ncbi:unnamed protein product [Rotaria sp. Silwood2]|nr:unnamed protein product [Rotaria sp. Silwood2]CAF2826988.1 unnamed protein product [Rotaria sp. Silwood2]CAF3238553.1 unnamed protein product [Rotaria sp. Silwood2]
MDDVRRTSVAIVVSDCNDEEVAIVSLNCLAISFFTLTWFFPTEPVATISAATSDDGCSRADEARMAITTFG